ncbi:hypothetical protein [Hymenobacter koreensis]
MPLPAHPPTENDNSPPLLPTWRGWYTLVLAALAAEICFFVWLSNWLSA